MKKLLLVLALFSLNSYSQTHSRPMFSNSHENPNWVATTDLGSLLNKSFQVQLGYRLHPNFTLGIHGGYGQTSDRAIEWVHKFLQEKAKVVLDKDVFRVGCHLNVFVKSNTEDSFFLGFYPTYERGSFQRVRKDNVKVVETKKTVKKGHYRPKPKKKEKKKDKNKNETEKETKAEIEELNSQVWVDSVYRVSKEVKVDDPDSSLFGNHIKLPIRLGYQWVLPDGGVFSTSLETGVHRDFTHKKTRFFVNLNILLGLAF